MTGNQSSMNNQSIATSKTLANLEKQLKSEFSQCFRALELLSNQVDNRLLEKILSKLKLFNVKTSISELILFSEMIDELEYYLSIEQQESKSSSDNTKKTEIIHRYFKTATIAIKRTLELKKEIMVIKSDDNVLFWKSEYEKSGIELREIKKEYEEFKSSTARERISLELDLKKIHDGLGDIEKLAVASSSNELSKHYLESANHQLSSARLNLGAMIFASLVPMTLAFSYIIKFQYTKSEYSLGLTGLFLITLLPIVFFAREARSRRAEYFNLNKIGLNLKVMDAYTSDLPENDKTEIKKKVIELIYTDESSNKSLPLPNTEASALTAVNEITKLLAKADAKKNNHA